MSTPNEFPGPEQPGSQATPPGYGSQPDPNASPAQNPSHQGGPAQPPPGYQQPPPGYQQPPPPGYQQQGYQQQPPPGYQQGGYPQAGTPQQGDFKFEMPHDMPKSIQDVMPAGGFSGIFKTDGLPQLLKISYIIWLVTAGLGLLFGAIGLIGSLIFLGSRFWFGTGVRGIIVSVLSLALMAAVVICAMKLKEGMQWARMALSAIVVLSFILLFFGASGTGLLGVVAAVLMWLPESTAWFNSRSGDVRR